MSFKQKSKKMLKEKNATSSGLLNTSSNDASKRYLSEMSGKNAATRGANYPKTEASLTQ